ncbi:unsaturated chondroitin disaccharide hydrolase [Paenibacillus mucilaginosus]|uniref:glycoside hydrolase family 88 protein n=1 Tax=Paenibacillus mucilaginosus TaxID=61624 RepID=UPI003D2061E1
MNVIANIPELWKRIEQKINFLMETVGDGIPDHADSTGGYRFRRSDWWTSGFYPGILWIWYDLTKDERCKTAAWHRDAEMEPWLLHPEGEMNHDVGFQFLPTAVIKHTLTGDKEARRRGLAAANYLAGRFNPAGGFLRAWNLGPDGQPVAGWAIIDCLMNLPLLFWAGRQTGDPRYTQMAVRHADTFLQYGMRKDGSACHILSFDPVTGEFLESLGGQGFAPDSAWSRGTGWALYGFLLAYRNTGDPRYLEASRRAADFFLSHLPEDGVPYWDFRLPSLQGEPRDSSAAAIAASGLLDLAEAVQGTQRKTYQDAAGRILRSLTENYAVWDRPGFGPILTGATGNRPLGHHVDCSLIFGDYYYVEALAKAGGWKNRIFG